MKVKPWQIALIVIGMLVGVGSIVYTLATREVPELADSYLLIDVETGEVFRVNANKYQVAIPAEHPSTGKMSLIRLSVDDKGEHFISSRMLGTLEAIPPQVPVKAFDRESGDLLIKVGEIKTYTPRSN